MNNIKFIMLSTLIAATCVAGDAIMSRKGMELTTMPQKGMLTGQMNMNPTSGGPGISPVGTPTTWNNKRPWEESSKMRREQVMVDFSVDIPADQREREGEKIKVILAPQHFNEDHTMIAEGQQVVRMTKGVMQYERRKGAQFAIPRYFKAEDDKMYETNVVQFDVVMEYWGTQKLEQPCIASFHVHVEELDTKGNIEKFFDNKMLTARLTVNEDLLFNAPLDVIAFSPDFLQGCGSEDEDGYDSYEGTSGSTLQGEDNNELVPNHQVINVGHVHPFDDDDGYLK